MINLGDLLKEYSDIKNPLVEKKAVCDVLNQKFNLNIKEDQVFFRKNLIVLKLNSVQKSVVYIKKTEVMELINKTIPYRFFNSIQF